MLRTIRSGGDTFRGHTWARSRSSGGRSKNPIRGGDRKGAKFFDLFRKKRSKIKKKTL